MLKELFSEDNGRLSSMRVNSFVALIAAILLSAAAIQNDMLDKGSTLILYWIMAAFAPKAIQKFAEKKAP